MNKAIFGGTFDPIHIGHIHIAYEALYKLNLDEVVFVPNGHPPHKRNKSVTKENIRYEMVEEAIKGEKRFSISNYEINNSKLSYTYDTLIHFNKLEPNTKWYFLVGVDSLMNFNKWKNIDIILKNCTLVVFSRSGYMKDEIFETKKFLEEKYYTSIVLLNMPVFDISSTDIKKRMEKDEKVYYMLPLGVMKIINKYNLYRNKV